MKTAVLLAVTLLSGAQEAREWKVDAKLTLEHKDGAHVFVLEGTTDLPAGTVLHARIYSVMIVDDPYGKGKREDDSEPLVWDGDTDAAQPGHKELEVTKGKFRLEVYSFTRKPYSLHYRGKFHYLPRFQSKEIVDKVGETEFDRAADLTTGKEDDFAAELKERAREASTDMTALEILFNELRKKFTDHREKHDAKAWKLWKDAWYAKVEVLNDRNKTRFGMWSVWMERQARMRIGTLCEVLRNMLVVCGEFLDGDKEALARAGQMFDGFHDYYEQSIEAIGLDMPLDPEKVSQALTAYENGLAPLRTWVEKGEGRWPEVRARARRECTAAILGITPLAENRKRAYKYLNEIMLHLSRILETGDAQPDAQALKKALAEHDAGVREFKAFAGLK